MQCVTCNNVSLFAPRLKILKIQIYPCGTNKKFECSWNEKHYFIFIWNLGMNNIAMQLEMNSNTLNGI